VNLTDRYGVKQYHFGKNGVLDITCEKRKNKKERPVITVQSEMDLNIIVKS